MLLEKVSVFLQQLMLDRSPICARTESLHCSVSLEWSCKLQLEHPCSSTAELGQVDFTGTSRNAKWGVLFLLLYLCALNEGCAAWPRYNHPPESSVPEPLKCKLSLASYGYLCKGTSIIPSFCWEQKCKCQNIKEKAHSAAVPKLKEGIKLTDFNQL